MLTECVVQFLNGDVQLHHGVTLLDVARLHLNKNYAAKAEPLLIKCDTGTQLYYDSNLLHEFVTGKITYNTLYSYLHCEGLYRNKNTLHIKNDTVEKDCLWLLRDKRLVLFNNDDFIATAIHNLETLFYKID